MQSSRTKNFQIVRSEAGTCRFARKNKNNCGNKKKLKNSGMHLESKINRHAGLARCRHKNRKFEDFSGKEESSLQVKSDESIQT
jgi:hypothetical protein